MKLSKEIYNGISIFITIGVYFLAMEILGLADIFLLRLLNIVIVVYFLHKMITYNYIQGKTEYLENMVSGFLTSIIGVVLSIIGLFVYVNLRGGDAYLETLSGNFLFGGGTPSIHQYCIGLFFEGFASSVIINFTLMQFYKDRNLGSFTHK